MTQEPNAPAVVSGGGDLPKLKAIAQRVADGEWSDDGHPALRDAARAALGMPALPIRRPQDATKWPPGSDPEQLINKLCGCAGRYNCDCVSVFNKACGDAWYAHNIALGKAPQ